jgi:hypothetical protein
MVTWRSSSWLVSSSSVHCYSVSVRLRQVAGDVDSWLPSVYGPAQDQDKPDFLSELHDLRVVCLGPWLLADDFNLIYSVEDKNNNKLNRCLMGQFRSFLNAATLKEVHLNGQVFT